MLRKIIDDIKAVCCLLLCLIFRAGFLLLNFYIVFYSQPFQRFYITVFFMLHQKCDGISTAATTKTFVNFFGRRNGKRRGFFVVKRAKAYIIGASFFQFYK